MDGLVPVIIGGGVGAGARYMVASALAARFGAGFPWGTLAVNLAGGLLMGLLAGALTRGIGEPARLWLGVGLLGGFTTFSAFGLDCVALIERGAFGLALVYVAASVIGTILLVALGIAALRA